MPRRPPTPTLFPYTTLFRSVRGEVFFPTKEFEEFNTAWAESGKTPFSNPRNVPAAALRGLENGVLLDSRSEEHTSELQSQFHLVCRLLLEKKKLEIGRER